jgi:hypothetical protein
MRPALVAAALAVGLIPGALEPRLSAAEARMPHIGKAYLFDYGELVIRVRYLTDKKLAWEQVKGPEAGTRGEEEYSFAAIRPGICFIWWQEKDSSVVSQVVDFEQGVVHTNWIAPGRPPASFKGAVRAEP